MFFIDLNTPDNHEYNETLQILMERWYYEVVESRRLSMLPSILAKQLQQGLSDYIETTFPMTNTSFHGSLERMLKTPDAVFHEPYAAVRLPFRVAEDEDDRFESIHYQFKPYVHQQRAFERLIGSDGRSTLIATGTGSGKTECFIYPILGILLSTSW